MMPTRRSISLPAKLLVLTVFGMCLTLKADAIKIRRPVHSLQPRLWTLRQTSSQDYVQDEDALHIHTTSLYLHTVGIIWISKIAQVEENVTALYLTDLVAKQQDCGWTKEKTTRWGRNLNRIKTAVENYTDTSDLLGLAELKAKENLTDLATFTLSVSLNFETFGRAFYHDADSDFVVVKFAAYLREQMLKRQHKYPSCTWTDDDRVEAGEKIAEIYDEFRVQVNNDVAEFMQIEPTEIFTEGDRKWAELTFGALYERFEE